MIAVGDIVFSRKEPSRLGIVLEQISVGSVFVKYFDEPNGKVIHWFVELGKVQPSMIDMNNKKRYEFKIGDTVMDCNNSFEWSPGLIRMIVDDPEFNEPKYWVQHPDGKTYSLMGEQDIYYWDYIDDWR